MIVYRVWETWRGTWRPHRLNIYRPPNTPPFSTWLFNKWSKSIICINTPSTGSLKFFAHPLRTVTSPTILRRDCAIWRITWHLAFIVKLATLYSLRQSHWKFKSYADIVTRKEIREGKKPCAGPCPGYTSAPLNCSGLVLGVCVM